MTEVKALTVALVTNSRSIVSGEDLARYFEIQLPDAKVCDKKLKLFAVNEPSKAIARMIQAESDGVMLLLGVEMSQEDTETLEAGFEFKVLTVKDPVPTTDQLGQYVGMILCRMDRAFQEGVGAAVSD